MKKNLNRYLLVYLGILILFSYFFLYFKHQVGNDSTISEWFINYEGGFTKRGIAGQLAVIQARIFEIDLRFSIFLLQCLACTSYFMLIYKLLFNLKTNKFIYLSIFTPIFLLYPVAEIEVLARKEVFLYSFFLSYFLLKNKKQKNIYKIIVLPFAVLIWEPVLFFFPFWLIIDYFEQSEKNLIKFFFKTFYFYLPAVILGAYIAFNPISEQDHSKMVLFLKNEFGERCYMSCDLLLHKSSIYQQSYDVFILLNFERVFRYLMVIVIGFGPLIILLKYTIFDKKILRLIYFIILFPIIVLFFMMTDWGRTVNMFYTFSILSFLYLYEKKIFKVSKYTNKNFFVKFFSNRKLLITFFIVFSFGWNPKTSIVGDVGSKPGYQIPKKMIKIINQKYLKK